MLTTNPQAGGLRAAASLIEYAEMAEGLSVTVTTEGHVEIQVTEYGRAPIIRAIAFAHLAATLSADHTVTMHRGDEPWRFALADWDGHPVKVYCPISAGEQAELCELASGWVDSYESPRRVAEQNVDLARIRRAHGLPA